MEESKFYDICDAMEKVEVTTDHYFPTVEEIKEHDVENNLEKYLPMLIFFSEDPFAREGIELDEFEEKEYKEMVSYVKRIIYQAVDAEA